MSRKRIVGGVAAGLVVISFACGGKKDDGKVDPKAGSAVAEPKAPPPPNPAEFSTSFYLDAPKVKIEGDNIKVLAKVFHNAKQPVAAMVCFKLLDGKGAKVDGTYADIIYLEHQSVPRGGTGKLAGDAPTPSEDPSVNKRAVKVEAFLAQDETNACGDPEKRRSNLVSVELGKPKSISNGGKQEGDAKTFPFIIDDFEAEIVATESSNALGKKSLNQEVRVSLSVRHRGEQPVQVPGGCVQVKDADGFDLGQFDIEGVEIAPGGEAQINGQTALDGGKAAKAAQFVAYISNYSCRDKPKEAISNTLKFGKDGK